MRMRFLPLQYITYLGYTTKYRCSKINYLCCSGVLNSPSQETENSLKSSYAWLRESTSTALSSFLLSMPLFPVFLLYFPSKHPPVTEKQSVDKEEIQQFPLIYGSVFRNQPLSVINSSSKILSSVRYFEQEKKKTIFT